MLIAAPAGPTVSTGGSSGYEDLVVTPVRSGIAGVVQELTDRIRTLVRLEAELATLELRQKLATFASGIGALVAAGLLALFALGFLFATIAAGLATFLDLWLALLLVAAGLVVLAVVAGLVGRMLLRRAGPPVPERAIVEAKTTAEALKGNGRG